MKRIEENKTLFPSSCYSPLATSDRYSRAPAIKATAKQSNNRLVCGFCISQDPNTKRFKQMFIYFDMDTQYANFWEIPFVKHNLPSTKQATKTQPKQSCCFFSLSFFISFNHLSVVSVLFCGLTKGISLKICMLCVRVKINKCSFEPFCVWILF